jgi:alkylhydroperoxidase family enzyme
MASNTRSGVAFAQPTTAEQRTSIASQCSSALKMTIPLCVDTLDDTVGRAYSGMPDRLYLLDKNGRVAYKGGRGPFGFKSGELEQAIAMMLVDESRTTSVGQNDPWQFLPKAEEGQFLPLPAWITPLAAAMPNTTAAMLELDYAHRVKNPLMPALRAKMRWVAASANHSPYGMAYAKADLKRAGATDAEIAKLSDDPKTWDELDRAALLFAQKMTREAYKVTDDEVVELRQLFGNAKVVAMVQLLAYANFQDRLLLALDVAVENNGPLPAVAVKFAKPLAGGATPLQRVLPDVKDADAGPKTVSDPEWRKLDFNALQQFMESQRGREPRIPVPSFESMKQYLPPTFPKGQTLKINWSLVCTGYQPELASAWSACTRNFGEDSHLEQILEESVFWVVTRSLQCFY